MAMLKYVTVTKKTKSSNKRFKAMAYEYDEDDFPALGTAPQPSGSVAGNEAASSQHFANVTKMKGSGKGKAVGEGGDRSDSSGNWSIERSASELGVPQAAACAKGRKGMVFKEVKGDLFTIPDTTCLAHCISEDCRMGKGIAKIFHKRFGGVQELLAQGVKPGGVAVLQRENRYIYYMVTKEKYWQHPTYQDVQSSLDALRNHCVKHDVRELAMPRIACGLDGLEWKKVSLMIRDTFKHCDISISVYTL
ncbi:ADP-ribose glycohydrolase OARD1-like [Ptychodera flava]|uniref:ADP-ribose glycohydrolase OARD1-like n=1 Tax=Ptychodera flava TaxID=63121 RepID=UPI00396A2729